MKTTLKTLTCGAVAALAVLACADGPPTPRSVRYQISAGQYPQEKATPDAVLTDQTGQTFDIRAETEGRLGYLYFGYTSCPDICPSTMANLGRALDLLEPEVREQVVPIFVTLDPVRDTAAALTAWLDAVGTGMVGLTGTQEEVDAVLEQMGYIMPPYNRPDEGGYEVPHPPDLFILTPDRKVQYGYRDFFSADAIAADARKLLEVDWGDGA